ncbi:hypothetical protein L681_20825 [Stenotrophomonas maltophilia MF89]|nr:hypothetical protein L681_20825 [Stenotrophomonas maltophilia MF89]
MDQVNNEQAEALATLQKDYDRLLAAFDRQVEAAEQIAGRALQQEDRIEELEEALAARQPVAQQPAYNAAGISLTACQLHEALLMAGDPELDVPFEDRSLVRIFSTEMGHSGPGLYCECVDAEEEGCILLDGTAPAIRQAAQAVDLGLLRDLHAATLRDMREHMAAGTLSLNDWRGFGTAALDAVLGLINSQAASNG